MSIRAMRRVVRRENEGVMLRRMAKRWLATGAVPVAHIVADLNDAEEVITISTVAPAARPTSSALPATVAFRRSVPC